MTKREKTCSKCHRPITGHPLPIGVNCELTIEKLCSKCKNPIKGHPKPTGSNCEFGRGIRSKSQNVPHTKDSSKKTHSVQPTKESYFDVGRRKMLVCACCGRLTPGISSDEIYLYSTVSKSIHYHGNYNFLNRILTRLQYNENVPDGVRLCYDLNRRLGARFEKLSSIPLDFRGVVYNATQCDVTLRFCFECRDSIQKGSDTLNKPPWAAYANGWATGCWPEQFEDASEAEIKMVVRGSLNFSSMMVAGEKNKILSSHIVTRMAKMGATEKLPRDLDVCDILVIYSNASLETKDLLNKKWVRCRRYLLHEILNWLRKNSSSYDDIDEPVFIGDKNEERILSNLVTDDEDNGVLLKEIWSCGDRPGAANSVSESNTAYFDLSSEMMLGVTDGDIGVVEQLKHFLVKNKSNFADNKDQKFFGATFLREFPYNCGTPNSKRQISVPRQKAFQRYLLLGDRTLAQSRTFVFYMFDELARYKLHLNVHLRIKQNPTLINDAISISPDDIKFAIQHSSLKKSQCMLGEDRIDELTDGQKSAVNIMDVIARSSTMTFCSREEREGMSRYVDAIYDRKGKPHGMISFTPKDSVSGWIAYHSGHLNGVSFEQLHNWRDPNFPSQHDIRKAASKDPVMSAIHFQKFLDEYVIPIYLGWDVQNHCSFDGGGEIGVVEAFVIPVEAQGAITSCLHGHMLVWLTKFPKTSTDEENDHHYNTKVCEYVNEHLIGSYPLLDLFVDEVKPELLKCPSCVGGFISSSPIPFICRTSLVSFEPIIGTCCECGCGFTSRRLRNSCREILLRILYVGGFESSKDQLYTEVKNIISSECSFPFPDILPKNLPRHRHELYMKYIIMGISKPDFIPDFAISEDDAEYMFTILRLDIGIELTHAHKFKVISGLLSLCFYLTLFFSGQHHKSCFKKGRMKNQQFSLCRYNMPVGPAKETTLTTLYNEDGSINKVLQVARGIGSEDLNAVVRDIFTISKSNDDQKVLTGQNIHYPTKYPTKVQNQTFCDKAFKRYQEGMEMAFERRFNSDPLNTTEHGKGIIHSLAYHHTNIIEVYFACYTQMSILLILYVFAGCYTDGSILYRA